MFILPHYLMNFSYCRYNGMQATYCMLGSSCRSMIISCNIHVTFSRLQAGLSLLSFKHHNYILSYHHYGVMSRSCDTLISSDPGILTMVKSYYYVFSEYTCILTSYCSFICNKCSSSVNENIVIYYYTVILLYVY